MELCVDCNEKTTNFLYDGGSKVFICEECESSCWCCSECEDAQENGICLETDLCDQCGEIEDHCNCD